MDLLSGVEKLIESVDCGSHMRVVAMRNIEKWLTDPVLDNYTPYIQHLHDTKQSKVLLDSFWRIMPFGTGGRRGAVGVGPNRVNPHTIALSIQGHCDYLRGENLLAENSSIVLGYDVRTFYDIRGLFSGVTGPLNMMSSRDLAYLAAEIYAANNVVAYLPGEKSEWANGSLGQITYVTTPELSFLIRRTQSVGGLNLSASHNHPDDNGGKFYNSNGGQDVPPEDEKLLNYVESVEEIRSLSFEKAEERKLVKFVPEKLHAEYLKVNKDLCLTESRSARIAFTPLCGTGVTNALQAMVELGFCVDVVPEQSVYDGTFKSVKYRIGNPEVSLTLGELEEVARENDCDIAFATDPDADRLGVLVPDCNGGYLPLSGNVIGTIIVETIMAMRKKQGLLPKSPIFMNTVVTSDLQTEIAKRYGGKVIGDLMVGFKNMAAVLESLEKQGRYPEKDSEFGRDTIVGKIEDFVFTTEEAIGFLLSKEIRDKDACGAAVHLACVASELKDEKVSFLKLLDDIYKVYGYYRNNQRALVMEGIEGMETMAKIQLSLRHEMPSNIGGFAVSRMIDYQKTGGPIKSNSDKVSRNILSFELKLENGRSGKLIVRPSGTEPKMKIYVQVSGTPFIQGARPLYDVPKSEIESVDEKAFLEEKQAIDILEKKISDAFVLYCLGNSVLPKQYDEMSPEMLLVSDIVPISQKYRLFSKTLPEALRRLLAGADEEELKYWFSKELSDWGKSYGELAVGAVSEWIDNWREKEGATEELAEALRRVSVCCDRS